MAEGKKGFILYADIIHTVKKLPIDKRGELFTIILEYVNDQNPEVKDLLIDLVWEPIKRQMKRDLEHWESIKIKRSEAGKMGGRPKKQTEAKKPIALFDKQKKQSKAKKAVIVNDTVNVNGTVTDTVKDTVKDIVKDKDKDKETKKSSAASGPPDEYKNIIKLWFEFVEKRNGVKPSFTAVDGKSLKSIIAYISRQQNKGQKTEDTFKFILDRWPTLSEWLQSNALDLKIFNSKINTILDQIKNGTGKKGSDSITAKYVEHLRKNDPDFKNY